MATWWPQTCSGQSSCSGAGGLPCNQTKAGKPGAYTLFQSGIIYLQWLRGQRTVQTVTARPGWSSSCQRKAHKVLLVLHSKGQHCHSRGRSAEQVMTDLPPGSNSRCCCWQLSVPRSSGSCCAKRESMLLPGSTTPQGRLRWEPGQQVLAETKHADTEEGNQACNPSTPVSLPKKQVHSIGHSNLRVPVCLHFTWLLINNHPGPKNFLHLFQRKSSLTKTTKSTPPSWWGQAKGDGSWCQPVLSSKIFCSLQTSHFLLFPSGFPSPTPLLLKSTTLPTL